MNEAQLRRIIREEIEKSRKTKWEDDALETQMSKFYDDPDVYPELFDYPMFDERSLAHAKKAKAKRQQLELDTSGVDKLIANIEEELGL